MKIVDTNRMRPERAVKFHAGTSNRILLESDKMGYTMTKTVIDGGTKAFQHYRNHLETCYCVSGDAVLTNAATNETFRIVPGVAYVLDKHDPHYFEAYEETVLICVFNPPLTGNEIHDADGSYPLYPCGA